ncbi:MAG: desulfoferrodoxin [Clostridia bacterium]|nr:desulfoferrodoxin [Clostridia bacterium]
MEVRIYQCEKCKKVIVSKDELKLDGWVELQAGVTDASKEKHVPVVATKCGKVRVSVGSVGHPMTAEHWIEWVLLVTDQGYQFKELTVDGAPEVSFGLATGEKVVAVYAYCNLHGLWKA